jgi:type II secretory pathway pseudopilin PulG
MIKIDKKTKNKKIFKHNKGFTLVEAMFAIFILTFVIVQLMTVVSSSLYSARYAKQEIIMNFLIQEALDGIRNDRDNRVFLNGGNLWEIFVDEYNNKCSDGKVCQIEIGVEGVEDIIPCSDDDDCGKIYLDEEVAVPYNHDEGEDTYMRRYIVAKKVSQTDLSGYTIESEEEEEPQYVSANNTPELEIEVFVIWKPRNSSLSKERSAKMTLLDWRQ